MPILILVILDREKSTQEDYSNFAEPETGDVTLFYYSQTPRARFPEVYCLRHGDKPNYPDPLNYDVVSKTVPLLKDDDISHIEARTKGCMFTILEQDCFISQKMSGLLNVITSLSPDARTKHKKFIKFLEDTPKRKTFSGFYKKADGSMSTEKTFTQEMLTPIITTGDAELIIPYAKKPSNDEEASDDDDSSDDEDGLIQEGSQKKKAKTDKSVWEPDNEEQIINLIDTITPAIKYEGFIPKVIRDLFVSKDKDPITICKHLVLCFAAYAHIGNNMAKLAVRRHNVDISKKVMTAVEALGVKKSDRTKNGLTLPRIAIAFMPEYLVYRKCLAGELQSQTSSTIDVAYKDLIFYGCSAVNSKAGYTDYHIEFSTYIFSPKEEIKKDDEKFKKSYSSWNKIMTQGYQTDVLIHDRMSKAVSNSFENKRSGIDFIKNGIDAYKSQVDIANIQEGASTKK